jgi:uncharacterized phage-associated protein
VPLPIKFPFHEAKALEALTFIADRSPGLTPLYVAKILFYAEKMHLNQYGRPIVGDTYIAMPLGPVPSTIKNYIDHNWDWVEKPNGFDDTIIVERDNQGLAHLFAAREPRLDILSQTDADCIATAIEFCVAKTANELSALTHQEKAWHLADANQPMDYEMFIDDDNPHKDAVVDMAKEAASYGVL